MSGPATDQPARLGFDLSGRPGSPVLVLGPSLGGTAAMWRPQLAAFEQSHQVLRYEHRGHGRSAVPPGPYRIDQLGADLVALLDELGIARVRFAGLSLGGMVGMWLAAHHPRRISRLALLCTSAYLPPAQAWLERAAAVRAGGMAAVVDTVVARWFTPPWRERHPGEYASFVTMVAGAPPQGYASCCDAIATMDLRPVLAQIEAPTLVLAGDQDLATPPEHGRTIADRIAGARFDLVAGAAHLANVEQAATVTGMLREFFAGPDPS